MINLLKRQVSNTEIKEQKYYEVFGSHLEYFSILKTAVLLLSFISIFLILVIVKQINKPPVVIRVDGIGNVQSMKGSSSSSDVTEYEVTNFVQTFLQYFTEWNYLTFDDDFKAAFKMMTEDGQGRLNTYLSRAGVIERIKNEKTYTKIRITEIKVVKDSGDFIVVKARGNRQIKSEESTDLNSEIIFEDELTLERTKRSFDSPWGILVHDWNESIFKS